LPIAAVVDDRILCMHGGLSPKLNKLHDIAEIERPLDVPDEGLLCDLLWSDPDWSISSWEFNETRDISWLFSASIVEKFCNEHNLDLICRGHEVQEDGYDFFAKRKLVTIFSAPNYCGEFDNDAAILNVDESLCCKIITFKPVKPGDERIESFRKPVLGCCDHVGTNNNSEVAY